MHLTSNLVIAAGIAMMTMQFLRLVIDLADSYGYSFHKKMTLGGVFTPVKIVNKSLTQTFL